ncbi:L,D-transpeptidase family protein [Edaphobacter acidisoli]|nr:L,D-transpeptidase family protein [Edaphobacter acidisoli]
MKPSLCSASAVCILAALLSVVGCRNHRETQYAKNLQQLVAKKTLAPEKVNTSQVPNLRWPNFSDYAPAVQAFYENRGYAVAWTQDGVPTAAAKGFIDAFQHADAKGLISGDYDASRWVLREKQLTGKPADAISLFDVAMTVNVMRFVSDLHIGRVNPSHFSFAIPVEEKKYNLAKWVEDKAVNATDVPELIASVEPDSDEYRQTEAALVRYQALAKQQETDDAKPLPMVKAGVSKGDPYPAAKELLARLQLEGDVAADSDDQPRHFDATLSAGVKHYQERHGMVADGELGPATIRSLNVPISRRVAQLEDSLERWRWLPEPYLHPRLMVNLPEFMLRGYAADGKLDFTMRVVDGHAKTKDDDHSTPVFVRMMRYLIFRPYWNVPVDIAKKELVPHIEQNPEYLGTKDFEATNHKGVVQTAYTAKDVAQGRVYVRQRPGPKNSLGLVKFMFPNQYDVYMHSTPETYLFQRMRRDYSHGCVRVQKADDLAAWVLNGQGDWDLDKVQDAMNEGPDNHTVVLKTPLPVVIFYLTARVDESGEVDFFDDVYKYDADLEGVLAKGPPYPVKPEPIVSKTKEGDTL